MKKFFQVQNSVIFKRDREREREKFKIIIIKIKRLVKQIYFLKKKKIYLKFIRRGKEMREKNNKSVNKHNHMFKVHRRCINCITS